MRRTTRLTYIFQAVTVGLMLATCWFVFENASKGHWASAAVNVVAFWANVWLYFVLAAVRKKVKDQ